MRHIHDGELRNWPMDPPPVFVFDEAAEIGEPGDGKMNKAFEPLLQTSRHTSLSVSDSGGNTER